jgi:hypothetical protein
MEKASLYKRWVKCIISLGVIALLHFLLHENSFAIAYKFGPTFVPLTDEQVFELAGEPCIRPMGQTSGCKYPEKPGFYLSGWDQMTAESDYKIKTLSLSIVRTRHEGDFHETKIRPLAYNIQDKLWLIFSLGYACIGCYVFILLRTTFDSQGREEILGHLRNKLRRPTIAIPGSILAALDSRKLQHTQKQYDALNRLFVDGLISEEVFLAEKEKIKLKLSHSGIFKRH